MNSEFWRDAWKTGRIGFHRDDVHPVLVQRFEEWMRDARGGVLVPLCGKSLDLPWMRDQGASVVGVEIVQQAVAELFEQQGIVAQRKDDAGFVRWSSPGLDVLQGSILSLGAQHADVDRVWDRASLVALSPHQRQPYVQALLRVLSPGSRILLLSLEFDQTERNPPPHSVPESVVRELYAGHQVTLVERAEVPVGSAGVARRAIYDIEII